MASVSDKASVANEAEARVANDAEVADINKANKADLTNNANKTNEDTNAIAVVNAQLDDHDKAKKANEIVEAAEANEADKANEYDNADKANEVNEATALDEAIDARFISFSLTKCSAIFAEVKEYFEANNNQLGLGFNVQIYQNWWQQCL